MPKPLCSTAGRVGPFVLTVPVVCVAVIAAACSSNKPAPATPSVTLDAGVHVEAGSSADEADAGLEPDAASPTGPTFFTGDAGAPPVGTSPVTTEQATDAAIRLALGAAAVKAAPKMEREGETSFATLREGEHFSMMINMMPNRCYTIVGHSPSGNVTQLDLKLYGPPLFNIEAGTSSPSEKNTPVIGKGAAALCPFLPVAVPYKVDAAATKGSGRIGVEVYARSK